ncbi:hypothetical protein AB4Z21_18255 [Paenibacillus sp. MCAF20]
MNITIGAKCWDGTRTKTLTDNVKRDVLPVAVGNGLRLKPAAKWLRDPKVKSMLGFAIPIALLASGLPPFGVTSAFAASVAPASVADVAVPVMAGAIKSKILHAFDPLIDLIMSLSFPIAGVMIAGGCLFILDGNRERGMQTRA